jgi:hypothetical protein
MIQQQQKPRAVDASDGQWVMLLWWVVRIIVFEL